MAGPAVDVRGFVARSLPPPIIDDPEDTKSARFGRYREQMVLSVGRKQHQLADEGSYFVFNGAETAITSAIAAASGFDATKPSLVIDNTDSVGATGKRIYLDYLHLLAGGTAWSNATSNTALYFGWLIDRINRWSSGGTPLAAVNPNSDVAQSASVSKVNFGALTVAAASGAVRTVVGQRLLRLPVSATVLSLANVDQWNMNFGGVESAMASPLQASATLEATAVAKAFSLPPIVIGPGHSALLYIWAISAGTNVAATLFPELGLWER